VAYEYPKIFLECQNRCFRKLDGFRTFENQEGIFENTVENQKPFHTPQRVFERIFEWISVSQETNIFRMYQMQPLTLFLILYLQRKLITVVK